jgi:hypothetical protein
MGERSLRKAEMAVRLRLAPFFMPLATRGPHGMGDLLGAYEELSTNKFYIITGMTP